MSDDIHYDFRIDAWKPETLPMDRLAKYLAELAKLFDHKEHIHFVKVRKGSAVPELFVDAVVAPKVEARLRLVGTPDAAPEANSAQRKINQMLRDDNASATLKIRHGGILIMFPGVKTPLAEEVVIHEQGEIDGVVIRVGGKDTSVPVWLEGEDGITKNCHTTRHIARELATYLFETPIRIAGMGKWRRTPERIWELEDFEIKSWQPLNPTNLTDAIEELRSVKGSEWNEIADPQLELRKLRGE